MDYPRSRSSKRSYSYRDYELPESNGRYKRRHMSGDSRSEPLSPPSLSKQLLSNNGNTTSPDDTVFRILCPDPKAGIIIGKGGSVIKALRQQTGARITIADLLPGADDRVILISSHEWREMDFARERGRAAGNRYQGSPEGDNSRGRGGDHGRSAWERRKEQIDSISPAQDALLRIHELIVDGVGALDGMIEDDDFDRTVVTRLLVPRSQVGCLLGKGGNIIAHMRHETRAHIRILPREELPPLCTLSTDEILQIMGQVDAVKRALEIVSARLRDNPPRDPEQAVHVHGPITHEYPEEVHNSRRSSDRDSHHFSRDSQRYEGGAEFDRRRAIAHRMPSNEELVFRMLCPNEKVGSVIGRGGSIIRALQEDIGVLIRITEPLSGCDERIVVISSVENPDDELSAAQEALLHVQTKIVDLGPDEDAVIATRLLVPSNRIGCLIGKGGDVIYELRRSTRANIKILGRDDLPKCASHYDEIIQIVGDIRVAREALIEVTNQLRKSFYSDKMIRASDEAPHSSFPNTQTRQTSYRNRSPLSPDRYHYRERFNGGGEKPSPALNGGSSAAHHMDTSSMPRKPLSPRRLPDWMSQQKQPTSPIRYYGDAPQFSAFNEGFVSSSPFNAQVQADISRSPERMRHHHHHHHHHHQLLAEPQISSGGHLSESNRMRPPSPPLHWAPQDGGIGRGFVEHDAPIPPRSGLISRPSGALITKTTVEVMIPEHIADRILGNAGYNFAQIQQMSGAKVNLLDDGRGLPERTIEISGTPDQAQAAQNLLQAFIFDAQSSAQHYSG